MRLHARDDIPGASLRHLPAVPIAPLADEETLQVHDSHHLGTLLVHHDPHGHLSETPRVGQHRGAQVRGDLGERRPREDLRHIPRHRPARSTTLHHAGRVRLDRCNSLQEHETVGRS